MASVSITDSIISKVDTSQLREFITDIDFIIEQIPVYFQAAEAQIVAGLRSIMRESYFEAVNRAGNFPLAYEEHLLQGISTLTPIVEVSGDSIYVGLPDIEDLGGQEELFYAMHIEAIAEPANYPDDFSVSNPQRTELGDTNTYERRGENAGLDDVKRLEYFEAMIRGDREFPVEFGTGRARRVKMMPITDPGGNETFRKRTQFWGNVSYPEWIVLEFGDPLLRIGPGGFVATFEANAEFFVSQYVELLADKIIDVLARGKTIAFRPDTAGEILSIGNRQQLASRAVRSGRFAQFID